LRTAVAISVQHLRRRSQALGRDNY
jgi:hypothetical protein